MGRKLEAAWSSRLYRLCKMRHLNKLIHNIKYPWLSFIGNAISTALRQVPSFNSQIPNTNYLLPNDKYTWESKADFNGWFIKTPSQVEISPYVPSTVWQIFTPPVGVKRRFIRRQCGGSRHRGPISPFPIQLFNNSTIRPVNYFLIFYPVKFSPKFFSISWFPIPIFYILISIFYFLIPNS